MNSTHRLVLPLTLALFAMGARAQSEAPAACQDFYGHVNAAWLAQTELPASRSRTGSFDELARRNEAVLQAAGLDLTLLRPSVIFGAEDRFLNLFADLQQVFPVMPLAGSGTKFQPVWVNDVAAAIVRCLQDRHSIGQTCEACGPETFTLGELVQRAGQWAGVNGGQGRPVIPLPRWIGWLQALAMEMLPGEPLMSRDNLASMKVDNVASGQLPGLPALGLTPAAASGVAPTYLGRQGPRSRLEGWRAQR